MKHTRADNATRLTAAPNGGRDMRSSKAAHVRRARQTRRHACHWPGCERQVPPARWGCLEHLRRLPKHLRDRIWEAYRPGQERDLTPSPAYVAVAREVDAWIRQHTRVEVHALGEVLTLDDGSDT